jgi:hypothetical protein
MIVAGVGKIMVKASATEINRNLKALDDGSSIIRTGAECYRWRRQQASQIPSPA